MINLLLCGNEKVFDGALTELISITNRTHESIKCYIFTAELTRIKPEYTVISEGQVEFLDKVVKQKNSKNEVVRIDVTKVYEEQFKNCANEGAYCTPYTLLRLLADLIPEIPEKLLYLDIDMMAGGDISKLYNIDITKYEYAAVKEKYPSAKIVLTLGGEGSAYQDETGIYRQGIFKVKAVDTTAAGDTFTGYFISSIIDGMPVQEGLELAAKASAIAVSRPGATASIPLKKEVLECNL